MKNKLIPPLGGELQNLLVDKHQAKKIKQEAESYESIILSNRQLCDLEMLVSGAYSPLTGFMDQNTYNSVVENLHLPDHTLWPIPIILDVSNTFSKKLAVGSKLALNDSEGFMLASLEVNEMWEQGSQQRLRHNIKGAFGCWVPL